MRKIDPEKFYTSAEICKDRDVMTANNANTRRQMLFRFIREKRIEAINLGGKKKPRYVVQGKHLVSYMDRQMKPGNYEVKDDSGEVIGIRHIPKKK